jgi:type II secretory pathway predicted ATPase ExeA
MDKTTNPAPAQPILETDFVRDALERLCDGFGAREPFLLVTGEAGTGKTTLVREAIARWGDRAAVAFVADPAMSRTELLEEIVRRFGAEPPAGATKPQLIASLEGVIAGAKLENRVPVVVIDDAHEIPADLLGELRLLGNVSAQAGGPFEIVLAGSPALEKRLAQPALEALRQRVAVHVVMQPLSTHQARRYLHEIVAAGEKDPQLLFPKKTCREMHAFSGGVPRTLGTLAAEALRLARKACDASVTPAHVTEAAAGLGLERREVYVPQGAYDVPGAARPGARPQAQFAAPRPAAHMTGAQPGAANAGSSGRIAEPKAAPAAARPHRAAHDDDFAPIPRPPHDPAKDGDLKPPGDPAKVSEWVGKFISPNEPRFGDLIGTGRLAEFADADAGFGAEGEPMSDELLAKLRRRRGRVLPRYRRGRRHGPEWLGTAALVLVIIAALVTIAGPARRMVASGLNAMSAAAERNAREQAARVAADSAAQVADAERRAAEEASSKPARAARDNAGAKARETGGAATSRATSSSPAPAKRPAAPEPFTPPASTTTPRSTSATQDSNPNQLWALEVGTYVDAGDAGLDRERLVGATGLSGWVVRSQGGYRVVLGTYSTRERAEYGARLLLGGRLVEDAAVIPLPPRGRRQ